MSKTKKKPGRPRDPRTQFWMRVSPADLAAWERAAERFGVPVRTWLIAVANKAVEAPPAELVTKPEPQS